jgi:phosphatidylserine decarboxylase
MSRDAFPFLIPLIVIFALCLFFKIFWVAWLIAALGGFVAFFFRDPARKIPGDAGLIVSPADGKVIRILALPDGAWQLSIFLSVLNVHINRSPIAGRVESVTYRTGKFLAAFDEKASVENEQNLIVINNGRHRIQFAQIAGILARRIVCWCKPGDQVGRGEKIGLIKFGSRVDVFFPPETRIQVKVGDKVKGGCSILGRMIE